MMEFTNQFHVPLPVDEAWILLTDIPRVMPCLPGATLKGTRGEGQYLGSILVKLGPIKLSFDGQAEFVRKDDKQHIAWLKGSGLDPKGRGSAESEFNFALLSAPGGGTDVTVTTSLQLSGAVAQYGRGSGMIAEVASHILKQFERNLAASLQIETPPLQPHSIAPVTNSPTSGSTATGLPTTSAHPTANVTVNSPEVQALLLQSQAVLAQAQALLATSQQALLEARRRPGQANDNPKELNMLSIGLKALWSQFKGLLSRRG